MSKSNFGCKIYGLYFIGLEFFKNIILVHYKLEGTVKEIIEKTKFNVLLVYYVQTFLIVTKNTELAIHALDRVHSYYCYSVFHASPRA